MDLLTILLIVLAVVVIVGGGFAALRAKQRSGSVLAAPETREDRGGS